MADEPPFLSANLRLEQQLGAGAMGEVWRASSLRLSAPVAVKVLHHVDSETARARFEQEARGAASIASPHVVRIYDFGVSPHGLPYIVMELLHGCDLRDRLGEGPMSAVHAAEVVEQACRAVDAAHRIGLVHRDIKPANLFLVDVGGAIFVKLVDFGIAKHLTQDLGMTETGALMGTPYYMSPEQLLTPRDIDHRCDLWALAVVAYACLAGTVPFQGETLAALSLAIHQRSYPPVGKVRGDLPATVDRWFEYAFHQTIDSRFQSATQLAATFQAALQGRWPPAEPRPDVATRALTIAAPQTLGQTTSPPLAVSQPAPRPRSRRGLVVAGAGLGVTALVASAAIAWSFAGEPTAARPKPKPKPGATASASAVQPELDGKAPPAGHPRGIPAAALEEREDDADPTRIGEVTGDVHRYDILAFARESLRWAVADDPNARLVSISADKVRSDGTVELDPMVEGSGGCGVEIYSPKLGRCWGISPIPKLGVFAAPGHCGHEFTGELPACTIARVLERAYRGNVPKGVGFGFHVDAIGRREWTLLDDESSDRHTIADECQ
jgi:serine/threonine protein kinase